MNALRMDQVFKGRNLARRIGRAARCNVVQR